MAATRTLLPAAALLMVMSASDAAVITDVTVFSSNSEGNNWNGLIWNTQGHDTDPVDHYKLYISADPLGTAVPSFLNHGNDAGTRVSLPLSVGTQTYSVYGEGVGWIFDPAQHFVLNLYFDGVQSAPGISGVQGLDNAGLAAAGHSNGLDIFGTSGQQEAGTLSVVLGNQRVTVSDFSWITDGNRDVVWNTWANDAPYAGGSGTLDYYGSFSLIVQTVPEPSTLPLVAFAALGLALGRARRSAR